MHMELNKLNRAVRKAREYRAEFEGAWVDAQEFFSHDHNRKRFVWDYGVLMGETRHARSEIWEYLLSNARLERYISDDSGAGIERMAADIQKQVLQPILRRDCKAPKYHISFCSKVATFYRPDVFVAFDQYARKGLATLLQQAPIDRRDYVRYLSGINTAWDSFQRPIIEACSPDAVGRDFGLRILDWYLMDIGGRKSSDDRKPTAPRTASRRQP